MKTARRVLGDRGEDAACGYLQSIGHVVLDRNWKGGRLEVDIISVCDGILHFVEVKSRTAPLTADPQVNVTDVKRRHLCNAALKYVHRSGEREFPADVEIWFDVMTVVFDGGDIHITYYPQAFIPVYV